MASRGARRRARGFLSAGDGHGLGCVPMETIGGMGQCAGDGVVVSVQWCGRGVPACTEPMVRRAGSVHEQRFRCTARRFGRASVLGGVGTLLGLDTVLGDVQCAAKGARRASEWQCRSRCPVRAREGTERGLGDGQRAAWAAAGGWVVTTVAKACWWRGGRGWLIPCALVGKDGLEVASGFEGEGERLGLSRHW
jgi:hypothetical protein